MNDDPSDVHVLYLNVSDKDGRMHAIYGSQVHSCRLLLTKRDKLREYFASEEIIDLDDPEYQRGFKAHVTIANTKFRRGDARQQSFDARPFLNSSANSMKMQVKVSHIHLSKRGVFDKNGCYHCEAEIKLP